MKREESDRAGRLAKSRSFRLRLFLMGIPVGFFAGISVAIYRFLIDTAEAAHAKLYISELIPSWEAGSFFPVFLWCVALAALAFLLARLVSWEPCAKGSGIPKVKEILEGRGTMRPFRVLLVQIFGGALAIGAGMSLGHAGPSVEIGAAAGGGFAQMLKSRPIEARYFLTSGAAAGLSAVFNAPLSGILFVLEVLHKKWASAIMLPAMSASVTAAIVIRVAFGDATIFLFQHTESIPPVHLPFVCLIGVVCGVCAIPFNFGIVKSHRIFMRFLPWKHPAAPILFALSLAALFGFVAPMLLGGGNRLVNFVIEENPAFLFIFLCLVGKSIYTCISFGSGVPGGFFFPSLVVGALIGALTGTPFITMGIFVPETITNVMILSMAAFLSATVRAPITAIVLLLELTGTFHHLMPLALAVSIAYVTSGLLGGRGVYDELMGK